MKNIFTMALLLCTLTIIAQSKIQVLDKSTGEPVVNAAVKVIGANKWTSTDIDGYFSLKVGSAAEVGDLPFELQTCKNKKHRNEGSDLSGRKRISYGRGDREGKSAF